MALRLSYLNGGVVHRSYHSVGTSTSYYYPRESKITYGYSYDLYWDVMKMFFCMQAYPVSSTIKFLLIEI